MVVDLSNIGTTMRLGIAVLVAAQAVPHADAIPAKLAELVSFGSVRREAGL